MVKKVLLVKTSSMGDILHTLPALTDAAKAIPSIEFDWVVEENFSQIPTWHAAVNTVIPVAIRRWRKNWFGTKNRQERRQFYTKLREHEYDAIIDAQGLVKSAFLITRKARGIKHGFDKTSVREQMASWFYDIRHHVKKNQHAAERIRQLFSASLKYTYHGPGDSGIAHHFSGEMLPKEADFLVFLHATTRDAKHWNELYWREVIAETGRAGLKIKLPWGNTAECERAHRLAAGFSHVEVLPKLSLAEIGALLAKSQGVVSVDTGLSHLTAALDKLNITLYGPTDPGLIGGYGKHQVALISPDKTMLSIKPSDVIKELKAHGLV